MIVGCYSMDLYCDREFCKADLGTHWSYTGQTEAECRRGARKAGWIFHRSGRVTCPECKGGKETA